MPRSITPKRSSTANSANATRKRAADSCWAFAKRHVRLGTLGMIQRCHERGFAKQTIADVFGLAVVVKAFNLSNADIKAEHLTERSWR